MFDDFKCTFTFDKVDHVVRGFPATCIAFLILFTFLFGLVSLVVLAAGLFK